jgi:translation initiation factor 3 subunit A
MNLLEIVHLNVIEIASPDLQNLYNWLEVEFGPLTLCNKAKIVIDSLEEDESNVYRMPLFYPRLI